VSELSTNAVRHAQTPFTVSASFADGLLRVEVADASSTFPRVLHPPPGAVEGRGMLAVDRLADRWAAEPSGTGKVVWFELGARPGPVTG
jgi:anti-sigma regulatory factor (Ser/Thr protein kinase)